MIASLAIGGDRYGQSDSGAEEPGQESWAVVAVEMVRGGGLRRAGDERLGEHGNDLVTLAERPVKLGDFQATV